MRKKNVLFITFFVFSIVFYFHNITYSQTKLNKNIIHKVPHYYQNDARWANYLYGGYDPLSKYGCGPTSLSIVISSLTNKKITPPKMADWSANNNYWVYRSGSLHSLIPDACEAFGLEVEKVYLYDLNSIREILDMNKLIICLMGPGHFTAQGHYIVIHGIYSDGTIAISDPFSKKNTHKKWKLKTLIQELSLATDNGSPAWAISNPNF